MTVAKIATGETEETSVNPSGKSKSGQAGGTARAKALSMKQRKKIAQKAARKRWSREGGTMKELKARLKGLQVEIGLNPDGAYTVYTESEPLFCFVRDSLPEIEAIVADTIQSYAKTFYGVNISVSFKERKPPRTIKNIPVQVLEPVKTLAPRLAVA